MYCGLFLFLGLSNGPLYALSIDSSSVNIALQQALVKTSVRVIELSTVVSPRIETHATIRLENIYEAPQELSNGSEIQIVIPGGKVGENILQYSGITLPVTGKTYEASLSPRDDGAYNVMVFSPTHPERYFVRNQVDGCPSSNPAYLHWDTQFIPIPYYIAVDSFRAQPELITAIHSAFKTWRDVAGLGVEFVGLGCTRNEANENDGINSILMLTDSWPFMPEAIAITRNFFIGCNSAFAGQILDSDILLNGVNHSFRVGPAPNSHDLQNILTHEIGHLLGMGHETDNGDTAATMYKDAEFNETKKRTLKASDIAGIQESYPLVIAKASDFPEITCAVDDRRPYACASASNHTPRGSDSIFLLITGITFLGARLLIWMTRLRQG